jgi:hypothetical protein
VSADRKRSIDSVSRIETRGVSTMPGFGRSADHLPASFWTRFEESLDTPAVQDTLDAAEWSLVQASRKLGYHTGFQLMTSVGRGSTWTAMDQGSPSSADALHELFSTLSGVGPDDCEIVELLPFEEMVLRVYGYWGVLVPGPDRNRRTASLVVRGLCAAVMDLVYGGPYDDMGRFGLGAFVCRQTRSVERRDPFDEFVVTRSDG